jgi:CBF/Mak21 family
MRMLHRRSRASTIKMSKDPYSHDEEDPLQTGALRSSLWELDIVMRYHYHQEVRAYAKVLKSEFIRKTAMAKVEEYAGVDAIEGILQELDGVDIEKEGDALKKNLMAKHGQLSLAEKLAG